MEARAVSFTNCRIDLLCMSSGFSNGIQRGLNGVFVQTGSNLVSIAERGGFVTFSKCSTLNLSSIDVLECRITGTLSSDSVSSDISNVLRKKDRCGKDEFESSFANGIPRVHFMLTDLLIKEG